MKDVQYGGHQQLGGWLCTFSSALHGVRVSYGSVRARQEIGFRCVCVCICVCLCSVFSVHPAQTVSCGLAGDLKALVDFDRLVHSTESTVQYENTSIPGPRLAFRIYSIQPLGEFPHSLQARLPSSSYNYILPLVVQLGFSYPTVFFKHLSYPVHFPMTVDMFRRLSSSLPKDPEFPADLEALG